MTGSLHVDCNVLTTQSDHESVSHFIYDDQSECHKMIIIPC